MLFGADFVFRLSFKETEIVRDDSTVAGLEIVFQPQDNRVILS
jgi:hypothetical protein